MEMIAVKSNRQLSSASATKTKESHQPNQQQGSTTVADTTIEESKNKVYVAFKSVLVISKQNKTTIITFVNNKTADIFPHKIKLP